MIIGLIILEKVILKTPFKQELIFQYIYVAKPRRGRGNKNGGHIFQYPPVILLLQLDPTVVDTPHGVFLWNLLPT